MTYYVAEMDNPNGGECYDCGHRHDTRKSAEGCARILNGMTFDSNGKASHDWKVAERVMPDPLSDAVNRAAQRTGPNIGGDWMYIDLIPINSDEQPSDALIRWGTSTQQHP